jgi:hypothetical protein
MTGFSLMRMRHYENVLDDGGSEYDRMTEAGAGTLEGTREMWRQQQLHG